ncbi:putative transcription factor WRKY family [Helianthus annuus]|nr:putative transcription factor WRKY family [Helianthus annuus]
MLLDQLQNIHNVDLSNEALKMSTQKILNCNNDTQSHYAGTAFRMWEPPSPLSGKPDNKDTDCAFASTKKKSRTADVAKWIQQVKGDLEIGYRASSEDVSHIKVIPLKRQVNVINDKEVEKALDEGYICQKFREMSVIDADYLRCNICDAKKLAQRSDDETYKGIHTCLRLSVNESASALSILKNSDSSTTVTDNPSGLNCTKKMSGSASIEKWKRQMEDIRSPFLKLQLASSYEPDMIISEVAENGSWNLSSSKEGEKELDDKITELHELVSPFGKNDATIVLLETCGYIGFLHRQVEALMTPCIEQGTPSEPQQQDPNQDLRSRGLCLIPVSSTFPATN